MRADMAGTRVRTGRAWASCDSVLLLFPGFGQAESAGDEVMAQRDVPIGVALAPGPASHSSMLCSTWSSEKAGFFDGTP